MAVLARFERLLPSLLMASGVMLLTAGALAYAPVTPAAPRDAASGLGDPSLGGSNNRPSASVLDIGPVPSPRPTGDDGALGVVASRIRIPSLGIDLPVIAGDDSAYPLCDVASYIPTFSQPGQPGSTYIYAHAQKDMFLPLLRASLVDDGAALIGALVEVYTTADELHLYEISTVKRHATDLARAIGTAEQLVLQTSEGPAGTVPKLQVAAVPLSVVPAPSTDAAPSAKPRPCEPAD